MLTRMSRRLLLEIYEARLKIILDKLVENEAGETVIKEAQES
jgi:hypothetical protein